MKTILEHERRTTKKLEWKKKTNKTERKSHKNRQKEIQRRMTKEHIK